MQPQVKSAWSNETTNAKWHFPNKTNAKMWYHAGFSLNVFKAYTRWLFIMYLSRSLRGLYSNEAVSAPNLADTHYFYQICLLNFILLFMTYQQGASSFFHKISKINLVMPSINCWLVLFVGISRKKSHTILCVFLDESGESKCKNKVSTPIIMSFWFKLSVNITLSKIIYKSSYSKDTQKWHQSRRTIFPFF